MQKDEVHRQESLLDPLATSHALYVCHKKGRDGSPTYDEAGFQLDYNKVDEWMKPEVYDKRRMMRGMDKAIEKDDREQAEICKAFFKGDTAPRKSEPMGFIDYVKDHLSKDLGIPWHQIGPKEATQWEAKGFGKKDYGTWWHEPNQVEWKRMGKMHGGCLLRKNL